jgi:hypothetical protein
MSGGAEEDSKPFYEGDTYGYYPNPVQHDYQHAAGLNGQAQMRNQQMALPPYQPHRDDGRGHLNMAQYGTGQKANFSNGSGGFSLPSLGGPVGVDAYARNCAPAARGYYTPGPSGFVQSEINSS